MNRKQQQKSLPHAVRDEQAIPKSYVLHALFTTSSCSGREYNFIVGPESVVTIISEGEQWGLE